MASAAARLLFLAGFPVAVLERESPLAVRRLVCFAAAVVGGRASVDGVPGRLVPASDIAVALDAGGFVAVAVDPEARCRAGLAPQAVVDGRMAKRPLDTRIDQAPLVVGLGPGFFAGRDVHAVVETQRGPDLGRVIWEGPAEADTRIPSPVAGHAESRVLRAPVAGAFTGRCRIGDLVEAGQAIGEIGGTPVSAPIAGLVRGLLADGVHALAGTKLGDIDPRGRMVDPARLSDKGRAVAAGALEAVLIGAKGRAGSVRA
jgi:xanthine dehydrogenase accessory factor